MKKTLFALVLITLTSNLFAQKKTTTSAVVAFDATTEKDALPKAENKAVIGSLDLKTGDVRVEAAVKDFTFSNPKMHEHFNSAQWMNSDAFPKFTFKGKVEDIKEIKFTKDGTYKANLKGELTIKDKTVDMKSTVIFVVIGGKINATTNFSVKLSDYGISGVPVESGKVAKEPKINVSASF